MSEQEKKFKKALEKVNDKYAKALKALAKWLVIGCDVYWFLRIVWDDEKVFDSHTPDLFWQRVRPYFYCTKYNL